MLMERRAVEFVSQASLTRVKLCLDTNEILYDPADKTEGIDAQNLIACFDNYILVF